jgi:hypothetical protein
MTVADALIFVNEEIAAIEKVNPGKELHPWKTNDAPESTKWWGLVQQRIALGHPNPHLSEVCRDLNLDKPVRVRSAAQQAHDIALAARRVRPADQVAA